EDLLISADQERSDEVVFAVFVGVKLQHRLDVAAVDEAIDFAIRVAGDVGQDAAAGGLFVEPVDRHDGKELIDGPAIGHRLEVGFSDGAGGIEKRDDGGGQVAALFRSQFGRQLEAGEAGPAQYVENQHRVISHHRPAGLGDDNGMLDTRLIADFLDVIDDVVG